MTRLASMVAVLLLALPLCGCQDKAGAGGVSGSGGEGGGGPSSFKPPVVDKAPPAPAVDRTCTTAADCEAVACECTCSGGEGLGLREDAVLRKDVDRWYKERGCSKPSGCPEAKCPPSRVDCVGGACHVVFGAGGK